MLRNSGSSYALAFYERFVAKRKTSRKKLLKKREKKSNVYGLYYNNNIESIHFKEKTEQCHKLGSSEDAINTWKKIIERQQGKEVCAIYGSGPYKLSNEYNKFSIKFEVALNDIGREKKTRASVINYNPSLEDKLIKPAKSGRKLSDQTRKRNPEPDVRINRLENKGKRSEKKVQIEYPNAKRTVPYGLFLRSLVPQQVERCQGNCRNKLKPAENGDYLLIKLHGPSSYSVKGESKTKYGPQYTIA